MLLVQIETVLYGKESSRCLDSDSEIQLSLSFFVFEI